MKKSVNWTKNKTSDSSLWRVETSRKEGVQATIEHVGAVIRVLQSTAGYILSTWAENKNITKTETQLNENAAGATTPYSANFQPLDRSLVNLKTSRCRQHWMQQIKIAKYVVNLCRELIPVHECFWCEFGQDVKEEVRIHLHRNCSWADTGKQHLFGILHSVNEHEIQQNTLNDAFAMKRVMPTADADNKLSQSLP